MEASFKGRDPVPRRGGLGLDKRFLIPMVGLALIASVGVVGATQTCDPLGEYICTGDSGTDPYAHCDGRWVDVYGAGAAYAQVCAGGGPGPVHVCIEASYDGVPATCTIDQHIL